MKLRPASLLLALSLAAAAGAPKEPPKELRLFAAGINKSTKGDILFDDEAAKNVMVEWAERGSKRLPFDYDHKMLAEGATIDDKKAAGWFTPQVRPGPELWAVECSWSPKASQEIVDEERGYFSPLGWREAKTGRLARLVNCALTNLPALTDISMLMASDSRVVGLAEGMSFDDVRTAIYKALQSAFPMKYFCIEDVFDDHVIVEDDGSDKAYDIPYTITNGVCSFGDPVEVKEQYLPVTPAAMSANETLPKEQKKSTMKSVLAFLALSEEVGEAGVLAEVSRMKTNETELLSLTEKPTRDEAIGTIRAWKSAAEKLPTVETELRALSESALSTKRAALLKDNERKFSPAELTGWVQGASLELLSEFVKTAPDKVGSLNGEGHKTPEDDTVMVKLSEEDKAVAKQLGISEADFAKSKTESNK